MSYKINIWDYNCYYHKSKFLKNYLNVSISRKYSFPPKPKSSNIITFNALIEEFSDFYCDQGIWAKIVGVLFP